MGKAHFGASELYAPRTVSSRANWAFSTNTEHRSGFAVGSPHVEIQQEEVD